MYARTDLKSDENSAMAVAAAVVFGVVLSRAPASQPASCDAAVLAVAPAVFTASDGRDLPEPEPDAT